LLLENTIDREVYHTRIKDYHIIKKYLFLKNIKPKEYEKCLVTTDVYEYIKNLDGTILFISKRDNV
jgi:hypothetical protein